MTTDIDVFLISGQSQGLGHGPFPYMSPIPDPTMAFCYKASSGLGPCIDPTADGVPTNPGLGSAWPSFAMAYYRATGKKLCIVNACVGGSALCAAADQGAGNWSPTGTLFAASNVLLANAMTALIAAGYTPKFRGIKWVQGETDAEGIINGLITQANHQAALTALIANYRALYWPSLPFHIYRIGNEATRPDTCFAEIREAQEVVAFGDEYTDVVFRGALEFQTRGLILSDGVHYNQQGLNEMGRIGAFFAASGGVWERDPLRASMPQALAVQAQSNFTTNVVSLRLPPGYWKVRGTLAANNNGTLVYLMGQFNNSAVPMFNLGAELHRTDPSLVISNGDPQIPVPGAYFQLNAPGNVYMVGQFGFPGPAGTTNGFYGWMTAERIGIR